MLRIIPENMKNVLLLIIFLTSTHMAFHWMAPSVNAEIKEVGMEGYEYTSIQGAIDAASDHDIVLVHPGTYVENINFKGKAITLTSEDPNDPSATIIDGNQVDSVVIFSSEEDGDTIIKGFQIVNGQSEYGGGILCVHASPFIINCMIQSNEANAQGGGIFCYDSASPSISHCTIKNNKSEYSGGGISSYLSSPTITDCSIMENTSHGASPYALMGGGGVYCYESSSLILEGCTISKNQAEQGGGGIYLAYGSPTVRDCIISENQAPQGGGIECRASSPTIFACKIRDNTATKEPGWMNSYAGGGILFERDSMPTMINVLFQGNKQNEMISEICFFDNPGYFHAEGLMDIEDDILVRIHICDQNSNRWHSWYRFFGKPCGMNHACRSGDILFVSHLQKN